MAPYQTLLVETHGAVPFVRLTRPGELNAPNPKVPEDMAAFVKKRADRCTGC